MSRPGAFPSPSPTVRSVALAVVCLTLAVPVAEARTVLFDASHRENAGNADWVIDADTFDLDQPHFPCGPADFENESNAQRFPTPGAGAVDAATPETYWTGAISAFAVDLVKLGYAVESLPEGGSITYDDAGNPQDLSGYDVFVLPEPNRPYSTAETLAIRDFVAAGGGLFLITDHQTSDRDCDGFDSPHIGNDLMGVVVSGGAIVDFGLFGIAFNVAEIAGQSNADYWFTDGVDDNVSTDPLDPIVNGPHGSGAGGLGLFGATSMTLDSATNPTVRGHVWKTDAGGQGNTRVTFATASYMDGRIACIGDSSPADDGTGDPGDNLYFGWDGAAGGVNNREIHLNAVEWLAGPDTTAPVIVDGPLVEAFDCTARISWTTDEAADGSVEYGPTAAYGSTASQAGLTTDHAIALSGLTPGTLLHFRVSSSDGSGNGPTVGADATFTTGPSAAPAIVSGPIVGSVSGSGSTVSWTTDEPADGLVRYGVTPAYGASVSEGALTDDHAIALGGLSPATTYHFRVESVDGCGNGPATSADATFTTSPPQVDLSGWTLQQYDSTQSYVFAPGTTLGADAYLVLARDTDQAGFEAEWGPLPAGTVFVNSGGLLPLINGGESFELRDGSAAPVDGVTIAMASGTTIQRNNPGDPAGVAASWTVAGFAAGSPGSGAGTGSGAGVVIGEAADAGAFQNEFVELYNDADVVGPDVTPPAAVADLVAEPRSDTEVRLTWTAPGDDGSSGTATAYDVRRAASPIHTAAQFQAATALGGAPAPAAAGSGETWDVTGLLPETTYYFALRATDDAGNVGPLSAPTGATTGAPGTGVGGPVAEHAVISELRTRGAVDHDDEFVELYNPTSAPIDLTGWSLQYKSASGTTYARFDLPAGAIPAGGYYLVTRPPGEYTGGVAGDAVHASFLMGAGGGHVFLVDTTVTLGSCTAPGIVDRVGYGSGDCPESAAAPAHAAGESIERAPGVADPACGNGVDTDSNAADFAVLGAPDPRNSATLEPPCRDLGQVGASLFLGGGGDRDELRWAAALGATGYELRRATTRDFKTTHPLPDTTHLLAQPPTPIHTDSATPPPGVTYYYSANAVN